MRMLDTCMCTVMRISKVELSWSRGRGTIKDGTKKNLQCETLRAIGLTGKALETINSTICYNVIHMRVH